MIHSITGPITYLVGTVMDRSPCLAYPIPAHVEG